MLFKSWHKSENHVDENYDDPTQEMTASAVKLGTAEMTEETNGEETEKRMARRRQKRMARRRQRGTGS